MHFLLFLHKDDNFLNRFRINDVIFIKLLIITMNLNDFLIIII